MTKLRLEWLAGPEGPVNGDRRVLSDFLRLNGTLGPLDPAAPEFALVLCADSRQPESVFDPEDRFFLVRTAGNLVDASRLPQGLSGVLVVAHRGGPGKGCGAVDATAGAVKSGKRPGHPDLAHILEKCALTPEENLERIGAGLDARGVPAALLIYDHVSAALEEIRVPAGLVEASARVVAAVGSFRALRHDPALAVAGLSLAQGQNPRAIVLNQLPQSMHRLLGKSTDARLYTDPMGLFEVKEGGEPLSPGALASWAYALTHALHGQGSFKDTGEALLLADSEAALVLLAEQIVEGEARAGALHDYLGRGGRLSGLVAEQGRFARAARISPASA